MCASRFSAGAHAPVLSTGEVFGAKCHRVDVTWEPVLWPWHYLGAVLGPHPDGKLEGASSLPNGFGIEVMARVC